MEQAANHKKKPKKKKDNTKGISLRFTIRQHLLLQRLCSEIKSATINIAIQSENEFEEETNINKSKLFNLILDCLDDDGFNGYLVEKLSKYHFENNKKKTEYIDQNVPSIILE